MAVVALVFVWRGASAGMTILASFASGALVLAVLVWWLKRQIRICFAIVEWMFAQGRVADAARVLEEHCHYTFRPTHQLFVFNRAVAYIFTGAHQRAAAIFESMRKGGAFESPITRALEPSEPLYRGYALALNGDLPGAREALDAVDPQGDLEPLTVLPRAVTDLRDGRASAALEALSERWADLREVAGFQSLVAMHLVRAMATSIVEPERTLEVERLVANVYPWDEDLVGWLGSAWPEMRDFCTTWLDPEHLARES